MALTTNIQLFGICLGLVCFGGCSQRLGKTIYSLAIDACKKLMYPKDNFGDIVLNNVEEYNKNMKCIIEELDNKGNLTNMLSTAKYLYRKGIPRFVKMMFNPKILQDRFLWGAAELKYFFDMHAESVELFKKFMTLFQMKISVGKHDWTPKPDFYGSKVTTYRVLKRKTKEIITG